MKLTSARALARLRAVWPPIVGRMASGLSCKTVHARLSDLQIIECSRWTMQKHTPNAWHSQHARKL